MRKVTFVLLLCLSGALFAQDVIYKTDGTEIEAKVTEITPDFIKYKKYSNPDGPVYNIAVSEVFMIVYENGEREVFKKAEENAPPPPQQQAQPAPVQQPQKETPPPPPPSTPKQEIQQPVRTNQQNMETQQLDQEKYQHTGLHAAFSIGFHMPQSMTFENKAEGQTYDKWTLDKNLDSKFKFVANAVWQTNQMAFSIGGVVNEYGNGAMSFYYVGLNYYFSLDRFSPYGYARVGYGFGKLDDTYIDDETEMTGYLIAIGAGTKFYLDNSWGLIAEFGYGISGISSDGKVKTTSGNEFDYESSYDVNALGLTVGVFFYP